MSWVVFGPGYEVTLHGRGPSGTLLAMAKQQTTECPSIAKLVSVSLEPTTFIHFIRILEKN